MRVNLAARGGLPKPVAELERLGVGVELQDFAFPATLDEPGPATARYLEQLGRSPLERSIHGAIFDLRPGSPDPRVVEVTRIRYEQSFLVAATLGARFVVLHSQLDPLLMGTFGEDIIARQLCFWRDLLPTAAELGLTVLLENVFDPTPDGMRELLDRVGSRTLGACVDVGHVLAYADVGLEEFVAGLAPHLRYFHVHETLRGQDRHQPPSAALLGRLARLIRDHALEPFLTLEYRCDGDLAAEVARVRAGLGEVAP